MSRSAVIVYGKNPELDPQPGTLISVHATAASATAVAAAGGYEFRTMKLPAEFTEAPPASLLQAFGTVLREFKHGKAPLGATVWALTLNGDIGDGLQGIFCSRADADRFVEFLRVERDCPIDDDLNLDMEGFQYRIDAFDVVP